MNSCWRVGNRICGSKNDPPAQSGSGRHSKSLVEFDEGMWLLLRRSTTFAGLRGILISKDSLPGSCAWSELKVYLSQRIEEGAEDEAQARTTSSA